MSHASLDLLDFSREAIASQLGSAPPSSPQSACVEYLAEYLKELKAVSVAVEQHYVDRHYLDDYQYYYARSFRSLSPHCSRLHFWTLPPAEVEELLRASTKSLDARRVSEKKLEESYLGFVVRRPLGGASMGRTILKTYPIDGRRHYEVVRPYRVNLCGLQFVIEGLAYQQQDGGAAVCASTALWSALQRVAHVAGHRTPTPSAITRASQSPFPASHGLEASHMALALSSLGYVADGFAPAENRALFRANLVSALQSQLPVVLLASRRVKTGAGESVTGHAVTVTGFSEPPKITAIPTPAENVTAVPMRAGSLDVIYVHDDNLGSHAHYELLDSEDLNADGHKKLILRRGRSNKDPVKWWEVDEWSVEYALVPKPEKLRRSVQSLFESAVMLRPPFQEVFVGLDLHFSVRFASGVAYRRELWGVGIDEEQHLGFQASLTLPRHIGVVSMMCGEDHLCDVLLDVSEVDRHHHGVIAVVAPGVPLHSRVWVGLQALSKHIKVPFISGPRSSTPGPEIMTTPVLPPQV